MTDKELLHRLTNENQSEIELVFFCPGCKKHHGFRIKSTDRPKWEFNGDMQKPTFSPSLLVDSSNPKRRCHLFLRNGKIQYLSDCHHELAGKTVGLSECNWR